MLLSWSDRLHIVLAPDRVSVTRLGKGLKPRQVYGKSLPCSAPHHGEQAWQPALQAMKQLLQQAGSGRAEAVVMLSNHFVRYQLVNAQPDLGSLDEEQSFVRFSFAEVYGNEVDHWALRWGSGLDVAAQVASAVDQALIDQMEKILTSVGAKLVSLQPYLMSAFNHVRKQIDARPHWFVLVEPGRACLGLLQGDDWKTLRSFRLGADWATELPMLIEREFQLAGPLNEARNMFFCLPSHVDFQRLTVVNPSIRILTMTPEMLLQGTVRPVVNVEVKQ